MRFFLAVVVAGALLYVPVAFAQNPLVPCNGPECQACHLVQLGQNILSWLIGIMASVIALVFAIGGMKMVMSGGNTESVSQGKSMMSNAVIGFVILLAGWLIVDTLIKLFVDDGKIGVWNSIQCVTQPELTTAPPAGTPPTGGVTTTPPTTGTAACTDDAGLIAKYNGSPVGQEAPELQAMISCYMADPSVAEAVDRSQIYTVDRSHPRCALTNGNPVCGTCSHSNNSCHYGRGHGDGAMAADFNAKAGFSEATLFSRLQARRARCGGALIMEGNHSHISMPGC